MPCEVVLKEDGTRCGMPVVVSVGGADVSAENLCVSHWIFRHGHLAVKEPVVSEE